MLDVQKKYFENKIETANSIELVTITYEILLFYLNEALHHKFDKNLEYADKCIDELIKSINFNASPSNELLNLYTFGKTKIVIARSTNDKEKIKEIIPIFEKLFNTYKQLEKMQIQDTRYPTYNNKGYLN